MVFQVENTSASGILKMSPELRNKDQMSPELGRSGKKYLINDCNA
jgi:hypothetical protein